MSSIGAIIKRLRVSHNLTQEAFAIEVGIDRRYMSDLENDKRNVSVEVVSRISKHFNLSLSQFFSLVEHTFLPNLTIDSLKQFLCDNDFEDSIVFENPDYVSAFVGVSNDGRAIYNYEYMIAHLVEEGMTYEEAIEFIDYNTIGALPYMGAKAPIILYSTYSI